jgi:antirestriction protein
MNLNQNTAALLNAATASHSGGDNQGFFYIDGIPTKGRWIDLDQVGAWEDIQLQLSELFPSSSFDEVLCADVEGLASHFYASNCDSFDLDGWLEFLEEKQTTHLEDEVISAYFDNCGVVSVDTVEEAYQGEYNSDEDFAQQLADDIGLLSGMDESLQCYFDWESWTRDLMFDYFESNGHYFRNI